MQDCLSLPCNRSLLEVMHAVDACRHTCNSMMCVIHMGGVQHILNEEIPAVWQVTLEPAALQGGHTLTKQVIKQRQGGGWCDNSRQGMQARAQVYYCQVSGQHDASCVSQEAHADNCITRRQ